MHSPILHDPVAAYWEVLKSKSIYEKYLMPEDHLSIGWVREYLRMVQAFSSYLKAVGEELNGVDLESTGLSDNTVSVLTSLRDEGFRAEPLLNTLARLDARGPKILINAIQTTAEELSKWSTSLELSEVAYLPFFAMNLFLLSTSRTEAGRVMPWMQFDSALQTMRLIPKQFPKTCPPEEYWKRIGWGVRLNLGLLVTGSDVPAKLFTDDDWKAFGSPKNVSGRESELIDMLDTLAQTEYV